MGGLKQREIAEQEEYDNILAWIQNHIDRIPPESFDAIVGDPALLRATVNGWLLEKKQRPPKPASSHAAYYLPSRRDLREMKPVNWPLYAVLGLSGGVLTLLPPVLVGVWNGISAIGAAIVFFTCAALAARLVRG